jgi:phytoene dehydrogenase-like protein
MARKIAIIGGGIAGLSTGCYGRMNGYDTEIFEMHTAPGGVCTGWLRKGYTFDGCLHFLVGTGPGSAVHRIWQELGAFTGKRVIDHEVFGDVVLPDGRKLVQYADLDRLVEGLKSAARGASWRPRDAESGAGLDGHDRAALDTLAADAKLWGSFRMPMGNASSAKRPGPLAMLRGMWKIRRYLPVMRRFRGSVDDFAARFHSADLKCFFRSIVPFRRMPAMVLLMLLAAAHRKDSGWPEGGSRRLAESIAERYAELGGVIHYGAKVEQIIVRDGRAVGVRLADGSEHFADEVISAADGRATLFGMLGGRFLSPALTEVYTTMPLYTPLMQVSFGIRKDLTRAGLPRLTTASFDRPLRFGSTEVPWVFLNNYAFDPTLSPAGKSAVTVMFMSPWEVWEPLARDREAYRAEKAAVLRDAAAWLESFIPGISTDIEVTDVSTPLTTVRYTGNYHASYEGWLPTPQTLRVKIEKRLPGLSHFSMVGQWTAPAAGLPSVAADGRVVIQELCAQDGKAFRTSLPVEPARVRAAS